MTSHPQYQPTFLPPLPPLPPGLPSFYHHPPPPSLPPPSTVPLLSTHYQFEFKFPPKPEVPPFKIGEKKSRSIDLTTGRITSEVKGIKCTTCSLGGHDEIECWFTHPEYAPLAWVKKQARREKRMKILKRSSKWRQIRRI